MFSAFDLQTDSYFKSGRNSETRKECEEAMIVMLTLNRTLNGENWNISNEAILDMFEVRIDKHKRKIIDGYGHASEDIQKRLE